MNVLSVCMVAAILLIYTGSLALAGPRYRRITFGRQWLVYLSLVAVTVLLMLLANTRS